MTPFARRAPGLEGVKVFIGMPIGRVIEPETHFSVLKTVYPLYQQGIDVRHSMIKGSSIVETARSRVCQEFLRSSSTHLFMVDSDQTWEPEGFLRILAMCQINPIVCAAYPIKREPITFYWDTDRQGIDMNEWGCLVIRGIGLGFTCVRREVIERLAEKAPKLMLPENDEPLAHIFRQDTDGNGNFRGEDMAFFADCREMGYEVWLDPTVKVGHVGSKVYSGDVMDGLRLKQP